MTDICSLGIAIWQCISGAVPYDIQESVLSGTQKVEIVQEKLRHGEPPGQIEPYGEQPGLSDLILNCWKKEPMSRTTANAVAKALQGIAATMAMPKPELEDDIGDFGFPCEPGGSRLDSVQETALEAVKQARDLNRVSPNFVQSSTKINLQDFSALLDGDDGSDPVR